MNMKKLIVTADDFGLTSGVNKAVYECFLKGILKNASIIANSKEFFEAAKIAKKTKICVGVHLNITLGKSLTKIPEITDDENNFRLSILKIFVTSLNKKKLSKIKKEFREQIIKVKTNGIKVSYLDSHKHIHSFPPIFKIVVELAKEFNLKVRLPSDNLKSSFLKKFPRKIFYLIDKKIIEKENMKFAPNFLCISGLSSKRIFFWIKKFKGLGEISSHPSQKDNSLKNYTFLIKEREFDRELLLSKRLKDFIESQKIKLITYNEI